MQAREFKKGVLTYVQTQDVNMATSIWALKRPSIGVLAFTIENENGDADLTWSRLIIDTGTRLVQRNCARFEHCEGLDKGSRFHVPY